MKINNFYNNEFNVFIVEFLKKSVYFNILKIKLNLIFYIKVYYCHGTDRSAIDRPINCWPLPWHHRTCTWGHDQCHGTDRSAIDRPINCWPLPWRHRTCTWGHDQEETPSIARSTARPAEPLHLPEVPPPLPEDHQQTTMYSAWVEMRFTCTLPLIQKTVLYLLLTCPRLLILSFFTQRLDSLRCM